MKTVMGLVMKRIIAACSAPRIWPNGDCDTKYDVYIGNNENVMESIMTAMAIDEDIGETYYADIDGDGLEYQYSGSFLSGDRRLCARFYRL